MGPLWRERRRPCKRRCGLAVLASGRRGLLWTLPVSVASGAPSQSSFQRWGLWSALMMSMLLNLFLLVGAVRQYRQRYQAELELARRAYPPPVAPGADGGPPAEPNSKAARAAKAREQATQRTENRRERQARIALVSPSATLIALRPAAAGPDGGSAKKPAPPAGGAAGAAAAEPTEPPQGRLAVGATGGPLAAGFVGLKRPPLGQVLRLWVQRAATQGAEPVLQHAGLIVVDGQGRANVLFDVPTGTAVTRAELRQEPVATPKAPSGEVVLAGDAPAEP
jgi:hypothetical protein